ncbi:uncharacterized protein LOC144437375 [Glandiceps talaboti]
MVEQQLRDKYRVEYRDNVAILHMNNGDNRFSTPTIAAINAALDEVERSDAKALITIGTGKFYSNGIDLKWISESSNEEIGSFAVVPLVMRVLTFPIPTVAAINGHAFAGGALFALAHDYRVMRTRQGWFCLPEIHLKLTFGTTGFKELIRHKVPGGKLYTDMAVYGKRFTGEELRKTGVIDEVTEMAGLVDLAIHTAKECLGKSGYDRDTLHKMKSDLYADVLVEREGNPGDLDRYRKAAKL